MKIKNGAGLSGNSHFEFLDRQVVLFVNRLILSCF